MTTETIEIDIRGQVCPSCLLLALREVNRHHDALRSGRLELAVLLDSRDAIGTIPQAVNNMGLAATVARESGCYRVLIGRLPEEN